MALAKVAESARQFQGANVGAGGGEARVLASVQCTRRAGEGEGRVME